MALAEKQSHERIFHDHYHISPFSSFSLFVFFLDTTNFNDSLLAGVLERKDDLAS